MIISFHIIKNYLFKKNDIKKIALSFTIWCFIIFIFGISKNWYYKNTADYQNSNFKVLGLNLPTNLSFAGESVPLNDYEIKESLEKEFLGNKSWKSSSKLLFSKAKKWFPLIEAILKKEGVPDDFKYVAVIESHLENVISPMGAVGFWQIMPNTALGYGLIINKDVDERFDVEKSTYLACKHFKEGHSYFKNWTLSAAAYNVGIGGIQKALKKQNTNNYYDLLLNSETGSFIYRILAFKTLLSNPEHFGISTDKKSTISYPKFKIFKVDSSITNLSNFAKHLGTNVVTLKTFNSWLIGNQLLNTEKRRYIIKIPKNKNTDISIYFKDVFPQAIINDSNINVLKMDTIKIH